MIPGAPTLRASQTPPGETAPGPTTAVDEAAVAPEQTGSRPAAPPPSAQRCEKSDLLVEQCGCADCRPDLVERSGVPDVLPIRVLGTWTEAQFDGVCSCGCEVRYSGGRGVEIVLAEVGGANYWCLLEHTRDAVFEGGH